MRRRVDVRDVPEAVRPGDYVERAIVARQVGGAGVVERRHATSSAEHEIRGVLVHELRIAAGLP